MEKLIGRDFQLWDYSPSFSRLLLRSPQKGDERFNVDLIFFGVVHVDIPIYLGEISIEEKQKDANYKSFTIHSSKGAHRIVASSLVITESEMDIFDSPLNTF